MASSCSRSFTARATRPSAYPFLMTRTGYGIPPYGDEYRAVLGPNAAFTDEGYIFVYQDTRGRFRVGRRVRASRAVHQGLGEGQREHRYLRHDRMAAEERAQPQRARRAVRDFARGLACVHGTHRRASRAACVFAAGAAAGSVPRRRLSLRRSLPAVLRLQLDVLECPCPIGAERCCRRSGSISARPTGTGSSWSSARPPTHGSLFRDEVPTWNDYMTHGTYDEYWQSRNVPKDLVNVRTPVLVVAGWFDAEDHYGPVHDAPGARRRRARAMPRGWWSARGRTAAGRAAPANRSATFHSARRRASTSAPRSSFRSSTTT